MKKYLCILLVFSFILLSGCSYIDLDELEQIVSTYFIDYDSYEQIQDKAELRNYIKQQQEQGILEISFVYNGEGDVVGDDILCAADACYVSIIREGENQCLYHITLTEFPGKRIADAYLRNDTSLLSADELLALDVATQIVEDAQSTATDNLDLERIIYDALIEHITYVETEIIFDLPEDQPRPLNAIGALLDGQANCQGYADAFYAVASIAGFEVGRMGVDTPEDPHMVNTICLDGNWYVVDVTFADDEHGIADYRLLNAGKDLIVEFWWDKEDEIYPIAELSHSDYFYYYRNQCVFDSQDALIKYFAEQWNTSGFGVYLAMLRNGDTEDFDFNAINDALYDKLSEYNEPLRYNFAYMPNEKDVFFAVTYSENPE